jgi:hypothetical protein
LLPAIFCAATAGIAWFGPKWKFSLRTLLIGMTVLAALLGLAIVASRGS